MADKRTERVTVRITPDLAELLDAYRTEHRWTRSTAVLAILDERLAPADPDADGG